MNDFGSGLLPPAGFMAGWPSCIKHTAEKEVLQSFCGTLVEARLGVWLGEQGLNGRLGLRVATFADVLIA